MHRLNPRRSACDRCRGHKLRCVRLDPGPNKLGVLMPCKRCLKAGTECIHTAYLGGKTTGENPHVARHMSNSSSHSASYQQRTPVSDRQLRDLSPNISSTQSAPHHQTQDRGSSGPHRSDKEPSPPWQMFATPTSSRSQLEFPKLSSHEDARTDHTTARMGVAPESSIVTPPLSERNPQRSSRIPSNSNSTFDLVDKVPDSDGRGFSISGLLHDASGTNPTTTSAHPHHMLQYPQAESLMSSNYFNTAAANVMASNGSGGSVGGGGGQGLREQQMQQQQQHHISAGGRSGVGSSVATTDDCLHRLSQLSSKLLMEFGKSGGNGNNSSSSSSGGGGGSWPWSSSSSSSSNNMGGAMTSFPSLPSGGTSSWHQNGTMANNTYLSSTINKLFDSLQVFLETVERLRPSSYQNFSSGSECSYSEQWDEPEFISPTDDTQMYPSTITADQIHGSSTNNPSAHHRGVGAESGASGGAPPSDDASRTFDMPTTLTILTCYTWLLKGYEVVLSGIYEALVSQDRMQDLHSLPPILHGTRVGDFGLEDHPDMQIEIVIHVGSQFLQRIEGVLGVHVITERLGGLGGMQEYASQPGGAAASDGREILDTKSAAALLENWFTSTHKGGSGGEGDFGDPCGGRRVQIRRTIDNIRKLIRVYWRDYSGK
uniref:HffR n=1 Tax=Hypoxylon fragiforme TaxID=63214 RepID=A0A5P9WB23_9PEZI|nr:HffR [Hypoxylon fragiforme]